MNQFSVCHIYFCIQLNSTPKLQHILQVKVKENTCTVYLFLRPAQSGSKVTTYITSKRKGKYMYSTCTVYLFLRPAQSGSKVTTYITSKTKGK